MDRRTFVSASALVAGFASGAAHGQPSRKLPIIAILGTQPINASSTFWSSGDLDAGLRDYGLEHGKTATIVRLGGDGTAASMGPIAARAVALPADVIVVSGMLGLNTLRAAARGIPIVIALSLDPVGQGIAESLRRPGGQITGSVWDQTPELTAKYPEFLKEAVPNLTRIGALIDPTFPGLGVYQQALIGACTKLGLQHEHREIRVAADIGPAIENLARSGAQAMFVYGSVLTGVSLAEIVLAARKYRLPDIHTLRESVPMGALMSFGASLPAIYRRAPYYVDRILRGTPPGEIPMELPTKYELLINGKTARDLGLKLPRSLLLRADEVIE